MERWQAQENLSHLVNIESLLGKLSCQAEGLTRATKNPAAPVTTPVATPVASASAEKVYPLNVSALWAREALLPNLRDRLNRLDHGAGSPRDHLDLRRLSQQLASSTPQGAESTPHASLNRLFEILTTDILASRDRLLMLNPGRRKMIEHRLEFIGRRVARSRGERLNRSLSLPEVLKESYRDLPSAPSTTPPKLSIAAWRGFVLEVGLYNLLELFFLKGLDVFGWRSFELNDLGRMNFAAHTFLSQRAAGFAHDKHCWNFVRTNVYSWYIPSMQAQSQLAQVLESMAGAPLAWSDHDLMSWVSELPLALRLPHLEFGEETRLGRFVLDLVERQLGQPVTTKFQGRALCKKVFVPALELGGLALETLDRQLGQIRQAVPNAFDGGVADEASQLHRALWACESESFEVFWTEVVSLLKILRTARSSNDFVATVHNGPQGAPHATPQPGGICLYRLPHAAHVVNSLGLELHNMDQLPLGGPEVSKLQQGSAAQIQQIEAFDLALVADHPDRAKSAAWMKALAHQLSYWRTLVGTGTNLNWGELHLYLAATKLKENGYCVYLSHRALPEGGDGEKLRKALLGLSTLEYFVELDEEFARPYRYLYVFRRVGKKTDRDQHRPRFGKMRAGTLDLHSLEETSSSQAEIAERGWDHMFVRGAAPLVRHLNHKFPKLFQVATVGGPSDAQGPERSRPLFGGADLHALEVSSHPNGGLKFEPLSAQARREALLVFAHNPVDLPWIACLLNSAPAQFWIRHQILATAQGGKAPRMQDLRSCPIVDLSHAPVDLVHNALEWMGAVKPDAAALRAWALDPTASLTERYAKYVAMARRHSSLARIVSRYRPLFSGANFEELLPEAVTQFYPAALLCHISQSPDIRIQYAERGRSQLLPENWTLEDVRTMVQDIGTGKPVAYCIVQTRQGPIIQMIVPVSVREYLNSQLTRLRGHTWGEALSIVRLPRDVALFAAQASEITRVVCDTARELSDYERALEDLALDLFEISADVRQFLPH